MAHFHVKPAPSRTSIPRPAEIVDIEDREGPREAYAALQSRLQALRSSGGDVPPELSKLEQRLLTECFAMSQGR